MTGIPKSFGSRDVEQFLVTFHGISPTGASSFGGRMKHLIRQKFPAGVDSGRGVPARYMADEFFQVVVVSELWQFGVPPARATKLVVEAWPKLRRSIQTVWHTVEAAQRGAKLNLTPIFWSIPVEALGYLSNEYRPWEKPDADKISVATAKERDELENHAGKLSWRISYIKADKMLAAVFELLKHGTFHLSDEQIALFMSTMAAK